MPLTFGANLGAITAQSVLSRVDSQLSSVFERLSSGQRINRASDDPAGLALADSLRADSRVYAQAYRNVNDGLSLFTIADAALEELQSIVVRIEELANQAANGSLSASQREVLNTEAQELSDEYFRISRSTEYNSFDLFDGSLQSITLQAGYGANGSIFQELGGTLGNGSFGAASTFGAQGGGSSDLALSDLNGDGNLDAVTADFNNGNISVFLGTGGGSFSTSISYTSGGSLDAVELIDVDQDGVVDVVAADNTGAAQIFLGNGDGTFGAASSVVLASSPFDIESGDFDKDGDLDLVSISRGNGELHILSGNGDGTFSVTSTLAYSGTSGESIAVADFNSDGNLDIAASVYISSEVAIFLGNGDGTFGAESVLDTGDGSSFTSRITHGDFDNDGIVDLAVTNLGDDHAVVYSGVGNGTFQATATIAMGGETKGIAAADLNGDGNLDITTSNVTGDSISIAFGNGDGSFQSSEEYDAGDNTFAITAGDLNNDGVYDIVAINNSDADVVSFLQGTKNGVAPLLDFDLSTQAGALQAIAPLSNKSDQISLQRGVIGAAMSRLGSAVNTIASIRDNSTAAEARIRDADIASDVAELTRLQILKQSTAAVLAQANLSPRRSLELLEGSIG